MRWRVDLVVREVLAIETVSTSGAVVVGSQYCRTILHNCFSLVCCWGVRFPRVPMGASPDWAVVEGEPACEGPAPSRDNAGDGAMLGGAVMVVKVVAIVEEGRP